jgi:ATP-dependent DNA helicase RecG
MKRNGSPQPIFKMDHDRMYFLTQLEIHPEIQSNIKKKTVLSFCKTPQSRREILENELELSNQTYNYQKFIMPLIEEGTLSYTIPEKINSRNQQYITTEKGIDWLNKH